MHLLRDLQQRLLSKRKEEEARLKEESDRMLEELKESEQMEREKQQLELRSDSQTHEVLMMSWWGEYELLSEVNTDMCRVCREESEATLKELRIMLEEERAVERDRLEAQKRRDIEHLKAESEEELQAERRRLQAEREEKVNSLKQEVNGDDAGSSSFLIFKLLF